MERAKKELLEKTYREFMRVGLESNDPNLLEGIVDENVMGFGTALDEKIRGIEEFKQLLINQKIQSEGIDLTWRNEPVHSFISEDENMVVFAEDVFFDINTEEGNLEMYLRFSAVLNFSNGQWKVIHWHGSKPEQVESEKDSWGIESYKQKAEELQKLVDEKTADLLGKNRELEIEAALERVRSMTMAMHSSADIGACILKMFEELTTLGVDEGTRFGIGILNHKNENNELWTARRDGKEVKMHIGNLDMTSHPLLKKARKAWKEQVPFHQYVLEGQDLLGYYQMLNNAPDYKIHIPLEKLPKKEIQHCFIFEHGFFYAFSPHEFRSELVQITQRFSAQFAQTYRRYLDLKKAESQAREAEIQLALERVRARSMAMKNSDELHDVLSVLFRQFDYLGIQPMNVFLSLFDRENRTLTYRASGKSRHRQPQKQVVHVDSMEELKGLYDKFIHDQSDSVEVIFYSKEVLPQLFGIFSETFDAMPEDERMKLEYFPEGGYSMAGYTPFGYLGYDHQRQATEEEKEILSRFCKEFTRVYQRFLDIQKAEAQSRESQVQLSLERVRARSMAMHNSNELADVCLVLFEEISKLTKTPDRFNIVMPQEGGDLLEVWLTDQEGHKVSTKFLMSSKKSEVLKEIFKGWREKKQFLVFDLKGKKLNDWIAYSSEVLGIPFKKDQKLKERFITSALFEYGYIGTTDHTAPSEEVIQLIQRFAKVFEQAYRRFLDLERVEKQAREAQIEVALERIRARAMAMHQTDELTDVLCVLFDQFDLLGINPVLTHLTLFDEANEKFSIRLTTTADNGVVAEQLIDIHAIEVWKQAYAQWKNCEPNSVNTIDYAPEDLPHLWDLLSEVMGALPAGHKINPTDFPSGLFTTQGHFKFGYLGFNNSRKATEEEKSIVSRFAREFGRTYQRFLDLEKAEAQAKEAQIEAALEKVRSRSMGMQNTREMQLVANEIREQLLALGVPLDAMAMSGVIDNDSDYDVWVGGAITEKPLRITHSSGTQVQREYNQVIRDRPELFMKTYSGKIMKEYFKQLLDTNSFNPEIEAFMKESSAFTTTLTFMKNSGIQIIRYTDEPFSDSNNEIVIRFGKVFEQAYIRFLDLQKAEAQAREARIETALEKVRSRTMGMQSSAELPEVANLLFLEVQGLGVPSWSSGFNVLLEDKKSADAWMSSEGTIQEPFVLRLWGEASFDEMGSFIRSKDTFMVQELGGKALEEHYNYMKSFPDLQATFEKLEVLGLSLPTYQINHLCKFSNGFLLFITYEQVPEAHDIFKRFTKVFDQTYTRFLDLQKAEAQAREAKIEAALERIRSHSIGMQSAADFGVVTTEMFEQLRNFGEDLYAAGIVFCDKHEGHVEQWHSIPGGGMLTPFIVPIDLDYIHQYRYDQWKEGKELFSIEIPSDFIEQHFKDIFELPSAQIALQDLESRNAPMPATPTWEIDYGASFKNGYILISSLKYLETTDILPRFARVFDQTYTRFLDLQKAEAQAREAQIEAALERVRSRTLAMQKSDELAETAAILFQQLIQLGIEPNRLYIGIIKDNSSETEFWTTEEDGSKISTAYTTDLLNNASFKKMYDAWKNKEKSTVVDIQGEELKEYIDYLTSLNIPFKDGKKQTRRIQYLAYFSKGFIGMASPDEQPRESIEILERFAYAFNLTFTRFNDLKVAESQAKEAQIELSLERIRAQVTAMRQSEELFDIVVTMRREFILLGHEADYFWHMKWIPESYEMSMTSEDGERVGMIISVPKFVHDEIPRLAEWEKSDSPTIALDLNGQEAWDYIDKMNTYGKYEQADPHAPTEEDIMAIGGLTFVIARTTHGEIGFSLPGQVPNPPLDSVETLVRFAGVFDLAYRRFEDLLNAEKQNRKAKIELALERVRARAMAMQEPEELVEVAQVMREEMGLLGVEELETSSIYINKSEGEAECWYSIKDIRDGAKTYIADHFDLKYKATWVGRKMLDFHQSSETKTSILMKGENRVEWINFCANQSTKLDGYYGTEIPERTYHLTKFSNGAIGAATPGEISDESWDLLQRAAAAFSLAYSRFKDLSQAREDLKKLKKAKSKAEKALKELKSAQEQLIQQEKLASLGQLTAGIAHEIKNPLNFVNNFSDLSRELIDEVFEEFENIEDSDSKEEILAILQDVKSNLSKVHEHGTRADAIVKSMLQHSRGNAGKIEAMDPNQLMREFANLAFHGMRAGKNPINVDLNFDLDPDAGLVNLVMEDFSRVILNICNNAFDAMRDRFKSSTDSSYLPKLTIQTKREKQKLILAFQDNGPGIPKDIVDKILQPFFTTKKGTEGTGLGLSITHDIIKAHGGELRVESEVGEGSTFSILLPLKMENV